MRQIKLKCIKATTKKRKKKGCVIFKSSCIPWSGWLLQQLKGWCNKLEILVALPKGSCLNCEMCDGAHVHWVWCCSVLLYLLFCKSRYSLLGVACVPVSLCPWPFLLKVKDKMEQISTWYWCVALCVCVCVTELNCCSLSVFAGWTGFIRIFFTSVFKLPLLVCVILVNHNFSNSRLCV